MGMPQLRVACAPTWGYISIDDVYTKSTSGTRVYSVHVLVGDVILNTPTPTSFGPSRASPNSPWENNEALIVSVELRETDDDSPGTIAGLILPIGRIAADRKEVFTPGAATFPESGVRLLLEHEGRVVMTFEPEVVSDGYRIEAALPRTPEGEEAAELVRSGKRSNLSVEFVTLEEERVSEVREVRRALISAAALVGSGAYAQARAELRGRVPRWWF